MMIPKPYPHEIEKDFRTKLGEINPLFCLLDVATSNFAEEIASSRCPTEFVRTESKRFGHHRFYPESSHFADSRRFLFISHIAFLQTCAEAACRRIRKHPVVDRNELSQAKGNFIRKTARIVLLTSSGKSVPNPPSSNDIQKVLRESTFSVVEYYWLIRNAELHAKDIEDEDRSPTEAYQSLPLSYIVRDYKSQPSTPSKINFSDVLLCSRALQDMVKSLCAGLLEPERHIIPHLQKMFGALTGKRRAHAALAFCQQELLLDEQQARGLLESQGWLA